MTIQVYRTHTSSYQSKQFFDVEKARLESIDGVQYVSSPREINPDKNFILISNTHTRPNDIPEIILKKTELLVHPNSGHDNFGIEFVKNSDFPIICGNEIRANAVCEYILSCIFQHYTALTQHYHWSELRTWNRKLLRNQKVLLIGHGHIGKLVHHSLAPLCKEIDIYDPYDVPQLALNHFHKNWSVDLAKDKDILIICASLNQNNYQFINKNILKVLAQDCLIINPARGNLINEVELVQHAKSNSKSTSYLDVFETEPFIPGYLHDVSNIKKTSHIAGVSSDLNQDIIDFEYKIINDFIRYKSEDKLASFKEKYFNSLLSNKIHGDILI